MFYYQNKRNKMSAVFFFFAILIQQAHNRGVATDESETSLRNLTDAQIASKRQGIVNLKKYINNLTVVEHHVAPVSTQGGRQLKTIVHLQLILATVLSLDDAQQIMKCFFTVNLSWQDPALAWNASDFHDVHDVEVPVSAVWTPDIFFVNSMDPGNVLLSAVHLTISSDGTVSTAFAVITETLCNMDHGKFPFDTQHCPVIVYSLSQFVHLDVEVRVENQSISEIFVRKSEWEVVSYSAEDTAGIPSLYVELRRRAMFYTMCLVVPMVLTSYMNTLVFLVPLEAGEKVSFLVSIFISTSVFTSFFTSVMPRGLEVVPASMKLLVGVTTESLVLLVCTLLVMWRYRNSSHTAHHSSGASSHQSSHQPDTAHSSNAGGGGRQWCCSSRERLSVVRVGPGKEEVQDECASDGMEQGSNVQSGWQALTPQHLDRLFFLMSFLATTVFLCVLFYD